MKVERVHDAVHSLGESPVWSIREQALYFVDLRAPAIHRYEPSAGSMTSWAMPDLAGAVVLARAGGVLVALASGVFRLDPHFGTTHALVAPEPRSLGNRMNDSKSDRAGRLWTSTMRDHGAAESGALYRIDPGLGVVRWLTGLCVPNGLAWSPDDRTMYFADTRDGRLRAYDYDADAGAPGAMRVLLADGAAPGRPDGGTVDAGGCYWSARYGGGCVVRVTPDGAIDRVVALPVTQPTSCAFGDADLRTLYVTTARQRLDEGALRSQPAAGALFAVRTDVGGLPEPECAL
ncbi:MAG: SMP-30/gluconolactonase/LRE family protein [Vicinamibacteria bacterium]